MTEFNEMNSADYTSLISQETWEAMPDWRQHNYNAVRSNFPANVNRL